MNSKIKNYVEVLFKGIPNTKKAQELREEILSNLNDHFEAHIAEGKSENQAYTEALADLGDIDALLSDLEPEQDLKEKIDAYRKKRAKNTSISVMLYIVGVILLIIFAEFGNALSYKNSELFEMAGVVLLLLCAAVATGLIIYTHMSMPQDVAQYISKDSGRQFDISTTSRKFKNLAAFMKLYWSLVLVIYLAVSFTTGAWYITWMIWVIGAALKNAIYVFCDTEKDETEN